jgi:hypothetical protein
MEKEEEKKVADWEENMKQHKMETMKALKEMIQSSKRDADE